MYARCTINQRRACSSAIITVCSHQASCCNNPHRCWRRNIDAVTVDGTSFNQHFALQNLSTSMEHATCQIIIKLAAVITHRCWQRDVHAVSVDGAQAHRPCPLSWGGASADCAAGASTGHTQLAAPTQNTTSRLLEGNRLWPACAPDAQSFSTELAPSAITTVYIYTASRCTPLPLSAA
jgi:hypothetical protein